MRKAAFIDRDGIVNVDSGYVHAPAEFHFVPGIFELCRLLETNDYRLIIITNQSGIARGLFTVADFENLTRWMVEEFRKKEISILKVYVCPHHPTAGTGEFKTACSCRKPEPGMILTAEEEWDIDLKKSILIGDKISDIQAGINAGIPRNFLVNAQPRDIEKPVDCEIFRDLEELRAFLREDTRI